MAQTKPKNTLVSRYFYTFFSFGTGLPIVAYNATVTLTLLALSASLTSVALLRERNRAFPWWRSPWKHADLISAVIQHGRCVNWRSRERNAGPESSRVISPTLCCHERKKKSGGGSLFSSLVTVSSRCLNKGLGNGNLEARIERNDWFRSSFWSFERETS